MSTINSKEDLRVAIKQLQDIDPRFSAVIKTVGEPPLRRREQGFESLIDIIVAQQVSRASADAIIARMHKNLRPYTAQGFQQFSDEVYVAQGLSRPKITTLRALSHSLCNNQLDLKTLGSLSDEEAGKALMQVKGIGPWTAEVYLLTCLGRADIWPAGDLALQVGIQMVCQLEDRPDSNQARIIARSWRPWRAVAARLIWSYYAHQKQRKNPVK